MFSISKNKISLTRGDTLILNVKLTRGGAPYVPAEQDIVRFAMKKKIADKEPLILKELTQDNENGNFTLKLEPNDTKGLSFGLYKYDFEFTDIEGNVCTFILGDFELTEEVY